jgi:hypothetical protein
MSNTIELHIVTETRAGRVRHQRCNAASGWAVTQAYDTAGRVDDWNLLDFWVEAEGVPEHLKVDGSIIPDPDAIVEWARAQVQGVAA